jgi:hypothetical protein
MLSTSPTKGSMNVRTLLLFAIGALLGALSLTGCSDDLLSSCGATFCDADQSCVSGVCVDQATTCTGCTGAQHCVSSVCVDNYTASNSCDPLRQCRNGCGLSAACAAECEADRSTECSLCSDEIVSCTSRESCDSAGSVNGCCETEFCACFPSAPGCGTVPDCVDGDTTCFNTCRGNSLACNLCLQPFDECADLNGATACTSELCSCLDSDIETDCQ